MFYGDRLVFTTLTRSPVVVDLHRPFLTTQPSTLAMFSAHRVVSCPIHTDFRDFLNWECSALPTKKVGGLQPPALPALPPMHIYKRI